LEKRDNLQKNARRIRRAPSTKPEVKLNMNENSETGDQANNNGDVFTRLHDNSSKKLSIPIAKLSIGSTRNQILPQRHTSVGHY